MKKFTKKGQAHITETIAVLFIFFVLILFGIIFYYRYAQVAIAEEQEQLLGQRAIETSLKVLFLPELLCSRAEAEPEDNCIELSKFIHAQDVIAENTEYYFELFSFSRISLHQIYPQQEELVLYERVKPEWENRETSRFVVVLRDTILENGAETFSFGYLEIEVYD